MRGTNMFLVLTGVAVALVAAATVRIAAMAPDTERVDLPKCLGLGASHPDDLCQVTARGTEGWPPAGREVEVFGGEELELLARGRVQASRRAQGLPDHVVEVVFDQFEWVSPAPASGGVLLAVVESATSRLVLVPWGPHPAPPGASVAAYGNDLEIRATITQAIGEQWVELEVSSADTRSALMSSALAVLD